ncbi:ester cyclase [Desulfococcus sp.]|uniref:ester cyclase n=1 Tax=Desulfococcus sp. TaxID=2025834 RepID=UPI003592ED18
MSEANKTVVRRIVEEIWNGKNHDRIDEFYAADFVNVDPSSPEVKNVGQFKQWVVEMNAGFPDEQVTIEDLIAEGDKVVKQWSAKATHTGNFMGIPPTNKKTNMRGITIYRIVEGKVKECVWSYDAYGFMVQLGVIPCE